MWDLAKNQITVNQEKLHSLNFPQFTTSNAIFCKNYSSLYTDKEKNVYDENNIIGENDQSDRAYLTSVWQSLHSLLLVVLKMETFIYSVHLLLSLILSFLIIFQLIRSV